VHFSVPTGNFGDILSGYYAKRMGLKVGKLVVATNENDILDRFFKSGKYWREGIKSTLSPSMDICVSSNFERYLFHLSGDNSGTLSEWMRVFEKDGKLTIDGKLLEEANATFGSAMGSEEEVLKVMKEYNEKHNYLFCPHSAIGVIAADKFVKSKNFDETDAKYPMVCLATASSGKFLDAV